MAATVAFEMCYFELASIDAQAHNTVVLLVQFHFLHIKTIGKHKHKPYISYTSKKVKNDRADVNWR